MFSIIIPLYNKAEYIVETIKSVLNQSFTDFEVIIVDDASTDGSLHLAEKIKDSRIRIFTKANEGVSAARNFGISKATRPILAFLDADDKWEPDYLKIVLQMIKTYPDAGIFATGYYMNNKEKTFLNHIPHFPQMGIIDYFKYSYRHGMSICITSAVCVKRSIALEMPMFRKGIKRGEDIDVWLRVCLKYPMVFYNEPLMAYRTDTPNSLSVNYTNALEEFPYHEWFSHATNNKYYRKYVVTTIYLFAKNAFLAKDYGTCYKNLIQIHNVEPMVKCHKRITLIFFSFFMNLLHRKKLKSCDSFTS